ncbi:MAG: hypothetical protein K2N03_04530 [Muribaculaceae bacterium]|nr:hypothetical protein [Muribaculaceae bacterium]
MSSVDCNGDEPISAKTNCFGLTLKKPEETVEKFRVIELWKKLNKIEPDIFPSIQETVTCGDSF